MTGHITADTLVEQPVAYFIATAVDITITGGGLVDAMPGGDIANLINETVVITAAALRFGFAISLTVAVFTGRTIVIVVAIGLRIAGAKVAADFPRSALGIVVTLCLHSATSPLADEPRSTVLIVDTFRCDTLLKDGIADIGSRTVDVVDAARLGFTQAGVDIATFVGSTVAVVRAYGLDAFPFVGVDKTTDLPFTAVVVV